MKPASIMPDSYSVKATWRAMFHLSYADGFPQTLAGVHPVAAPFILWQLKGKGYSNCRVVVENGVLNVYADR